MSLFPNSFAEELFLFSEVESAKMNNNEYGTLLTNTHTEQKNSSLSCISQEGSGLVCVYMLIE